jgi:hypothetical protein
MAVDRSVPLTRAAARAVPCPTLMLEGGLSPAIFHRVADVLEAELSRSRRVRAPGADHFLPITAFPAVSEALIDFLGR